MQDDFWMHVCDRPNKSDKDKLKQNNNFDFLKNYLVLPCKLAVVILSWKTK